MTRNRQGLAMRRSVVAALAGAVVLVGALLAGAEWPVAVSAGWGTTALVIVLLVWYPILRMDAAATKAHARAEDFSRPLTDFAVLTASLVSLVAVGYLLVRAGNQVGFDKALLILLALSVVAISWTTVHTLYTVRYGDLFYGDPIGGIDFNEDGPPDYLDFAYLAFTIGMTFQVSDTSLTSKQMRRTAIRHALLSFVFVAVIIALAINGVASLLR
ncbi:MAG: DUF1345 domain-containing protein [Gaiellaceae bacterium]